MMASLSSLASSFQPSSSSCTLSLSSHYASIPTTNTKTENCRTIATQVRIHQSAKNNNNDDDDDDEIEFDPLLSPHAYARGTDAGPSPSTDEGDDDWSPFQMRTVKDDFRGASENEYGVKKSDFTRKWSASLNDMDIIHDAATNNAATDNDIAPPNNNNNGDNRNNSNQSDQSDDIDVPFDPLLSPHLYPKGTSAGPIKKQKKSSTNQQQQQQQKIGILLIDHGSRRPQSNSHLETLASYYQQKAPSNYIVKAAHMEIAKPSIFDGIQSLIQGDDGVDVVVCHPYFLSPGRHVIEDVPELIDEAMKELKIGKYYVDTNENGVYTHKNVQVVCTGHVGSMMDRMVDLIGQMVDETMDREGLRIETEDVNISSSSSSLGGFLGEVQRMLDEQL